MSRAWQRLREGLAPSSLLVLATTSLDGTPGTTPIGWVYACEDPRLLIALDRRGLAYANVLENPRAALELFVEDFTGTLRGHVTLAAQHLDSAPFPCAAFAFEVEEIRDHGAAGVTVRPPAYHHAFPHRSVVERRVIAELRRLAVSGARSQRANTRRRAWPAPVAAVPPTPGYPSPASRPA